MFRELLDTMRVLMSKSAIILFSNSKSNFHNVYNYTYIYVYIRISLPITLGADSLLLTISIRLNEKMFVRDSDSQLDIINSVLINSYVTYIL